MSPEEESQAIQELYKTPAACLEAIERQLNVLHLRAQVLISIAGIVLTITGFSGRIIADTNQAAQILISIGLLIVLIAAVFVYMRVMSIRWVTSEAKGDINDYLPAILERRNRKTAAFRQGGWILCLGLACYFAAFTMMLTA